MNFVNAKKDLEAETMVQSRKTLLEVYLTSKDLDVKDIFTMVSDMLIAGLDSVKIILKCFRFYKG